MSVKIHVLSTLRAYTDALAKEVKDGDEIYITLEQTGG